MQPLDPTRPDLPAAGLPDLVGAEIAGYRVVSLIGQGGMGRVYKAFDSALGRFAAIKVILGPLAQRPENRERFEREIRALQAVHHPNVARIYSAGEHRGAPFYAMELIEGHSLAAVLAAGDRLAGRRCLDYLIEAAEGLEAAARQGLVHRDVKPSNLMIDAADHLKIVDFGVVRRLDEDSSLTRTQAAIGTPAYMAPEQVLGGEVDHRSDVYALGASFYHLFAGEPPFAGADPAAVSLHHVHTPLPPLSRRNPRVPRAVAAIVDTMLAKRPEDRYQDYRSLIEDLHRARAGRPPLHAGSGAGEAASDTPARAAAGEAERGRQRFTWMAAGFAAALVAVLALAFVARHGGEAAPGDEAAGQQAAGERIPAREAPQPQPAGQRPRPPAAQAPPADSPLARHVLTAMEAAYRAKTLANLRYLASSLEIHVAEQGALPADLGALADRLELHPQALVDGWGHEIGYRLLAGGHYRLTSAGPDGRPGTTDDVVLEDGFVVQGEAEAPAWPPPGR
jgi:eukaryotic-like serine/threonine-protein kinase